MLPAVVAIDDPTHAGAIFTNSGGPGHPGADFVVAQGRHLQLTFDKPGERHYGIINWDPRDVGQTTPRIKCMDDLFDRDAFNLELCGSAMYGAGEANLAYILAVYESLAIKCQYQADLGVDVWGYVSTALVVEDMVHMVDKLEE